MIQVQDLCKSFKMPRHSRKKSPDDDPRKDGKWFHAVKNVSFEVSQGKILGLLGANGAGKTTILRMLSTAIKPTGGHATVMGLNLVENPLEIRKKIGFLSGSTGLYDRLTPREMVAYYGKLHGMSSGQLDDRMKQIFDTLEMGSFLDKRNSSLSSGMKQKVSIARTLIHDPEVIVFDEPTTGLDVAAAENILTLVENFRSNGKTVLFSTHNMHEVRRLCDEIVIINLGEKCFSGTTEQMREHGDSLGKAFLNLIGREASNVS